MEGVAVLDPQLATAIRGNPNAIIESILADGTDLMWPSAEEIHAPSSIRRFEFSFASPDLSQTKEVHFRHKLEGMDESGAKRAQIELPITVNCRPGRISFE